MRTKFIVERVYNNGQNIGLVPIKEVAAEKLWDPNKRIEVTVKPEVQPPAENVDFFEHSPGGEIVLLLVRPQHASHFAIGKTVTVDFTVDP